MANILFLEDDPTVRALLANVLRGAGHTVYSVSNADEAENYILGGKVELVVADWIVPTGGGAVALHDRMVRSGLSCPVLATTANAVLPPIEGGWITKLLVKPFDAEALLKEVQLLLHKESSSGEST